MTDHSVARFTTCPVIVGREPQLAALRETVGRFSHDPRTEVALISGEAGIGKTRLLAETLSMARALSLTCVGGRCFEQDRSLPFAPFRDLLHAFPPPPGDPALAHPAAYVLKIAPELASAFPAVALAPAVDPEQDKRLVFHALFSVVLATRARVITIEDLHWCDEASLDFLQFAIRQTEPGVLWLASYRDDEVGPALSRWLAQLSRVPMVTEHLLQRLAQPHIDEMIQRVFGLDRPTKPEFLAPLFALTDGNPFFVEELLKSMVASGDIYVSDGRWQRKPMGDVHIPRTVQAAVEQRAAELDPRAQQVLTTAAVMGRRFDFGLLHAVISISEAELVQHIKTLTAAQLVIEESADVFAFRHALTREAMCHNLIGHERRSLHRAIALAMLRTLDEVAAAVRAGDLAYHLFEAGDWEGALQWSWRAGEDARRMFTPGAAVEHYLRAQTAMANLGARRAPATPSPHALLRALGQTHESLGDYDAARMCFEHVLTNAPDGRARWQANIDLGFLWAARDYARTGSYYDEALRQARGLDDPVVVAHTLNRVGNWLTNTEQPQAALRMHREALTIFEAAGLSDEVTSTLDLLAMTTQLSGDSIGAAVIYGQVINRLRAAHDMPALASALGMQSLVTGSGIFDTMFAAPNAGADPHDTGGLILARQCGRKSTQVDVLHHLASNAIIRGDYASARQFAGEALAIAEEIGHLQWMCAAQQNLGALSLILFDFSHAAPMLAMCHESAGRLKSGFWMLHATSWLARCHLRQGDVVLAGRVLGAHPMPAIDTPGFIATMSQRQLLATHADHLWLRGDLGKALVIVDHLTAYAPAGVPVLSPRITLLRGDILDALGDREAARAEYQAVYAYALQKGWLPYLWQSQAALANSFGPGDARAAHARDCALACLDQLVKNVPADMGDAFVAHATAMIHAPPMRPGAKATSARRGESQGPALTQREHEVASLVAHGDSNREIAAKLVLGERTVETHITHIMRKLDVKSRSQIARWVLTERATRAGD